MDFNECVIRKMALECSMIKIYRILVEDLKTNIRLFVIFYFGNYSLSHR